MMVKELDKDILNKLRIDLILKQQLFLKKIIYKDYGKDLMIKLQLDISLNN